MRTFVRACEFFNTRRFLILISVSSKAWVYFQKTTFAPFFDKRLFSCLHLEKVLLLPAKDFVLLSFFNQLL